MWAKEQRNGSRPAVSSRVRGYVPAGRPSEIASFLSTLSLARSSY